jgi:hypothetical protein
MAEIWGAVIGAAAVVGAGAAQSNAAKGAARAQGRASDAATAETAYQYDQTRNDLAPMAFCWLQCIG